MRRGQTLFPGHDSCAGRHRAACGSPGDRGRALRGGPAGLRSRPPRRAWRHRRSSAQRQAAARAEWPTNTASAPVLITTRPPIARINSVQDRPSPATSSGLAAIACVSRYMARSLPSPPDPAAAKRAMARARPCDRGHEVRRRATVDAMTLRWLAGHLLERCPDGPLQRVVDRDVVRPGLEMPRHHEKACMLARAIVVQLAGALIGPDQPVALDPVIGFVRPAAQIGLGHAHVGQPAPDQPRVKRRRPDGWRRPAQAAPASGRRRRPPRFPPAAAPEASCRTIAG